jgi:PST family polysaccharide transporter
MVRIMLLIGVPSIIFAMLLARSIVLFILGPRWLAVTPIFAWFCFGSLASSIYSSTFWLFITQGRSRNQIFYVTATSVISVLSFIAGLPWGPTGVAAGAALSFVFLSTPLVCWGATKNGAVNTTDLARALLPFLFAGLATVGAVGIAKTYLRVPEVVLLGVSLPISYGTFLTVLLCLPNGNPVVRKAWYLGMLLIRRARTRA